MDIQERLLDSHKSVSRLMGAVWILIFVMSVYVAQRSLAVIGASPDVLRSLTAPAAQISLLEVGFSYRTMTMLWPVVLGALCLFFTLLEVKRCRIEESLRSLMTSNNIEIAELDPLHISAPLLRGPETRIAIHLIAILPMLAIGSHLLMIFIWVASLGWTAIHHFGYVHDRLSSYGFTGISAGAVFSLSSTLFAILGFFGALSLWNTVRKRFVRSCASSITEDLTQEVHGAGPGER